ncbi:hypothetical protein AUJ14_00570 [Candidatus Micrarchaeota archaeon CG1_02_55_22]|nr:MAG: hypothetical protein AUJ14_00570 [Candidatus Micrarchaeota archaeon CG1_02_55_22]
MILEMKTLKPAFRAQLRRIYGELLTEAQAVRLALASKEPIVCVGDVSTLNLTRGGVKPIVSVVDFKSERKPLSEGEAEEIRALDARVFHAFNPPGCISGEAAGALSDALAHVKSHGPAVVIVEGEEDLLLLPAIVLAPDGTLIFYGQPKQGIVLERVNSESRARAQNFLEEGFV